MIQDRDVLTWPMDVAATRSRTYGAAILASLLYASGTLTLLLQAIYGLAPQIAEAGIALILIGMTGSIVVLGKVLVTRRRLID